MAKTITFEEDEIKFLKKIAEGEMSYWPASISGPCRSEDDDLRLWRIIDKIRAA